MGAATKSFQNEDHPSRKGRNPADEGNGGQVVGQSQPVEQQRQKDGKQNKGNVFVQIGHGIAEKGNGLAHCMGHVDNAQGSSQPPGCAMR